jgi:hypothetical protein
MRLHWPAAIGIAILVTLGTSSCAAESAGAEDGPAASESASPTPTSSSTPTATPATDSEAAGTTYATLEELRTALVAAGATCPEFIEENTTAAARESGTCPDYVWALSIYDTTEARNSVLAPVVDSLEPADFLVGPNWLVTTTTRWDDDPEPTLADVQPEVGGTIWTYTDPLPPL